MHRGGLRTLIKGMVWAQGMFTGWARTQPPTPLQTLQFVPMCNDEEQKFANGIVHLVPTAHTIHTISGTLELV